MADPRTAPAEDRKTAFALALEAAEKARPVEVFDVSGFFGLGAVAIPRVGIRRPTKFEQDRALRAAHKYVDELAGDSEAMKSDRDILLDAKNAAIAFEFCREVAPSADDPTKWEPTGYPAFPSPRWACQHLAPEQIGVLVHLANEWRAKQAPSPVDIADETIEAYVSVCTTADEPEYSMAGCSREYMVQLEILTAHKLIAARREMARMAEELAALRAPAPPPPPLDED